MGKPERLIRLARVAQAKGLDSVLLTTPSNLYYFCGFRTTLYTRFNGLMVPSQGQPAFVTSYVDEKLAKSDLWSQVWISDIRIHGPIERPDVFKTGLDALRPELSRARCLGVDAISFALFAELSAEFPRMEITAISAELASIRRSKDQDEIANIRRASTIALDCMEEARRVLSYPGVSEVDLAAELEFKARRLGADGYGYPILISSGEKLAAPHSPPSPGPIPSDTPFVRIAFAPTFNGYSTSLIRTFCPKPVQPAVRRYATAFFAAMKDVEHVLRAGVTVQDILSTVAESYRRAGLLDRDWWRHRLQPRYYGARAPPNRRR